MNPLDQLADLVVAELLDPQIVPMVASDDARDLREPQQGRGNHPLQAPADEERDTDRTDQGQGDDSSKLDRPLPDFRDVGFDDEHADHDILERDGPGDQQAAAAERLPRSMLAQNVRAHCGRRRRCLSLSVVLGEERAVGHEDGGRHDVFVDRNGAERFAGALASPNASAAVLFAPTTSASRPVSRPSRSRELETSYATMSTQATTTDAVLVATPIAVSFRASERFRNQCLALDIVLVLDDLCEAEQLGADLEVRAARRAHVDGEAHAAVLQNELGDAAHFRKSIAVADGEDRCALQRVEKLAGPLDIEAADVEQMTRANRTVGFEQLHRQLVTVDRRAP